MRTFSGRTSFCHWSTVSESPTLLRSWREFTVSFFSATLTELQNRKGTPSSLPAAVCRLVSPLSVSYYWRPVTGLKWTDQAVTMWAARPQKEQVGNVSLLFLIVCMSALFYLCPWALGREGGGTCLCDSPWFWVVAGVVEMIWYDF